MNSTGTMPPHTFVLGDHDWNCATSDASHLSAASAQRADAKRQAGELPVASVLGCHLEVLEDCHLSADAGSPVLASSLTGPCPMATHVLRGETLEALSLADYPLTGTFKGAFTQPKGPYTDYDTTFYLAQNGLVVTGISTIKTRGHDLWGDLEVEGRLSGNVLFFRDVRLLDDNLPIYLAWCIKGGYFVVDPRDGHLHGPAVAPMCEPGTIDLRRVPDHPRVIVPGPDDGS